MKVTFISSIVTLFLLIPLVQAQEANRQSEKKSYTQTIDMVTKQLKHLKACLQGKEVCSKIDFAMLGAGLFFIHGIAKSLQYKLFNYPPDSSLHDYLDMLDPSVSGFTFGQKIFGKPRRLKSRQVK